MHRKIKKAATLTTRTAVIAALGVGASTAAMAAAGVQLQLVNGWTNGPFSTRPAAVKTVSNVVRLSGAIASGTSAVAFTLPNGFRPLTDVYVAVDLCNATNGRLHIVPSGVADVEAEGGTFSNAQCFTSLDGANFSLTADQYVGLALVNGWTNAPFSTSNAAVKKIADVVQFKGAIASGTVGGAFTLPKGYRPLTDVYIAVDMCNATNGRIHITPSGAVDVETASGQFANAQCFTSLDGASFALNSLGYTPLTLINGWTSGPFSTSSPAAKTINGVTHFEGAMATGGTNPVAFVLPAGMRPRKDVYLAVDLCGATNGRIHIVPNGTVDVEAGTFSNAQCFTSLDGASFKD